MISLPVGTVYDLVDTLEEVRTMFMLYPGKPAEPRLLRDIERNIEELRAVRL